MRRWLTLAAVAGVLLLVGGVAVASVPDSSGVIHGCRKNGDGTLKVIDSATQTCGNGFTALNWDQHAASGTLFGLHGVVRDFPLPDTGEQQVVQTLCPTGEKFIFGMGIIENNTRSNLFLQSPPTDVSGISDVPSGLVFAASDPWAGTGDDAYIHTEITCAHVTP
jgi:hypothetical protein